MILNNDVLVCQQIPANLSLSFILDLFGVCFSLCPFTHTNQAHGANKSLWFLCTLSGLSSIMDLCFLQRERLLSFCLPYSPSFFSQTNNPVWCVNKVGGWLTVNGSVRLVVIQTSVGIWRIVARSKGKTPSETCLSDHLLLDWSHTQADGCTMLSKTTGP